MTGTEPLNEDSSPPPPHIVKLKVEHKMKDKMVKKNPPFLTIEKPFRPFNLSQEGGGLINIEYTSFVIVGSKIKWNVTPLIFEGGGRHFSAAFYCSLL